jgi:hypothetical protein
MALARGHPRGDTEYVEQRIQAALGADQ